MRSAITSVALPSFDRCDTFSNAAQHEDDDAGVSAFTLSLTRMRVSAPRLYPPPVQRTIQQFERDWAEVHQERRRPGITLRDRSHKALGDYGLSDKPGSPRCARFDIRCPFSV